MTIYSKVTGYTTSFTAAISTGVTYASQLRVPGRFNPFTATIRPTTGDSALVNGTAQKFFNKNAAYSFIAYSAATLASVATFTWINNNYLVKYVPSFGRITPKVALAIAGVSLTILHAARALTSSKVTPKADANQAPVNRDTKAKADSDSDTESLHAMQRAADLATEQDNACLLADVIQNGLSGQSLEVKGNNELVMEAVKHNGLNLAHASKKLQNNIAIVLAAVTQDGRALQFASSTMKNTRTVVLAAVENKGSALMYAAPRFKNDKDLVLLAVSTDDALQYASTELKDDEDVVIAAIGRNGLALCHASPRLQQNEEIVFDAVSQMGSALEHAPELQNNRKIVLAAVRNQGTALQFASPALRKDPEIVSAALENDWLALNYVASELKEDGRFMAKASQAHLTSP